MNQQMMNELKLELKKAICQHRKILIERYPDENLYGYSLYTSDDLSAIGPVSNRMSAIKVDANSPDYFYYKYCPDEWCDWDDYGLFDVVNRIIRSLYNEMEDEEDDFYHFKQSVLKQALQALKELSHEGWFGAQTDDRFLIVYLSDSNDEIMEVAAEELNTAKVYTDYMSLT